jgi:hypothetical protein
MRRSLQKLIACVPSVALSVSVLFAAQLCLPAQTTDDADRADPAGAAVSQPTVPTSNSTTAQSVYTPMTAGQRVEEYFKDTTNPLSLVTSAAGAGYGQWRDRPREWKEGGLGYGRRYASSYAEHIVRSTLLFGASSLFHEDNRYFRSGETGVGSRIGYALGSTFLARSDDGSRHFSVSRVFAFAGAALISRLWQPPSTNKLRNAGINFGSTMGTAMGFEVVREFWPHK